MVDSELTSTAASRSAFVLPSAIHGTVILLRDRPSIFGSAPGVIRALLVRVSEVDPATNDRTRENFVPARYLAYSAALYSH